LNKLINSSFEVTDTHKNYNPHVTICYVKKETGNHLKESDIFEGKKLILDTIVFSGKDNRRTLFKLI